MSTQYAVDLVFNGPKTPALDQLTKQIKALERASQNIGGQDPLGSIGRSATQARAPVAALGASMAGLQFAAAAVAGAFATLGVGLIAREMIQAAGAAQQLAAAFTSLTGSAQEAEKLRDSLFRLSKTTPFQNEDLLQAARGFLAVGVEVDKVEGTINRVGALAANSGQSLGRIALIYSQIYAKGRLQGEENLQLLEAGIDIQQELAQVTGLSGVALQDAMSKGKISIDNVNKALVLATGNMQGLDLAAKSVAIQWQNLGDNAGQVFLGLSKALSPALAALPGVFNQAFDKLFPDLATLDKVFAPLLAEAEKFGKLLTDNQQVVDALATAFQSLLNLAIEPAVEGLRQMNKWLEENPDGLVNAVLDVELGLRRSFLVVQSLVEYLTGPSFLAFRGIAKLLTGDIVGAVKDQVAAVQALGKPAATFGRAVNAQRLIPGEFATPEAAARAGDLSTKAGAGDAARADSIKKLKELEKDAAKEVRDLNLDYIKEMSEARKGILKEIQAMERDLADRQRDSVRSLVDARADLKLQTDIRGLQGGPDQKAYMKARLEEEAAFGQRERDRQRSFDDKQRDLATKLEDFKVKTAETIGNINKKYQERYGEMQRKYAENAAKVLEVGGTNAGKEMVKGALEAARIISSASAGTGGGDTTDFGDQSGNTNFTTQYFRRLSMLESDGGKNWVNPSSGATGFFQFLSSTVKDLPRLGINPAGATSRNYNEAAQTAKLYAIAMRPIVKQLLMDKDVKGLDRILNRLWTSLPGGAEEASPTRMARANALIGGTNRSSIGDNVLQRATAATERFTGVTNECASTVKAFMGVVGINADVMDRSAKSAEKMGTVMTDWSKLKPGDIVARGRVGDPEHVGVYTGEQNVFHQSGSRGLRAGNYADLNYFKQQGYFIRPGGTPAGGTTAGVMPTTTMDLKPAPYPAMPKPLPAPNLTAELAPYNRALDEFRKSEEELVKTLQAADVGKMFNARVSEITAITEGFDKQIEQNGILLSQDEKRLEYLEQGINPALAQQFAELDSQFTLAEKRLKQEEDYYQLKLGQLNLTEQEKKYYQDILDLIKQRQAALGGQKATIRNQAVQADEQKKSPRAKLLETIGDKQEKLNDLLNPATQLTAAAESIGDAFGQAFQDIASGSKTAKEAMGDMFRSIGASFIKMAAGIAAQQLTLSLLKMFTGALGGGAGAAGGGSAFGGGGSSFSATGGGLFNSVFSYAGGGFTGSGARSGGIDGQGGFPAILHPQETVIDHTEPRASLRPSGQMMGGDTATPEISYGGPVLVFNSTEYVMKKDVPKIIAAGTAATGNKMRNSVAFRKRTGI